MLKLIGDNQNIQKLLDCLNAEFNEKVFLKNAADEQIVLNAADGSTFQVNKDSLKELKFNRRQKKLCKILNEIICDPKLTRACILSDADNNKANFGGWRGFTAPNNSFQCNTVNVNDALYIEEKTEKVISAVGFIIHELYETFLDQAKGFKSYELAHKKASELQAEVDGIFIHPKIGGHILDDCNSGHIYMMIKNIEHTKITYKVEVDSMIFKNFQKLNGWFGPKKPGGADEELK